jgi:hypothetical protein
LTVPLCTCTGKAATAQDPLKPVTGKQARSKGATVSKGAAANTGAACSKGAACMLHAARV